MPHEMLDDEHVILPRPYISVVVTDHDQVIITVIAVSEDNERVTNESIVIPIECAAVVGEALLRMSKRG